MNKTERLTEILKRLDAGEDPDKVKEEARKFLSTIDERDLVTAEQELMKSGVPPEGIRHLCSVHMEMLRSEQEKVKSSLRPGHVIHTLMSEHEIILSFLDELEKTNQAIQKMDRYSSENEEFKKLLHIAEHLLDAEPHHQREEKILFSELERRGFFGPPQVMRLEHEDLRKWKKELKYAAENVDKIGSDAKKRIDGAAKYIILTLRDHIFKENNILYPTALQAIQEEQVWKDLKSECDKIGYCCFTPTEEEVHTLDLRPLHPFQRHEKIFQSWYALEAGQTLKIINDHDPKPLRYQFEAEHKDEYQWEYEKKGPDEWIVQIKRLK